MPPQYIIGNQIDEAYEPVDIVETNLATVRLYKVKVEYMYSNPTGKYNLSMPEKKLRSMIDLRSTDRNYAEYKKFMESGTSSEFQDPEAANVDDPADMDDEDEFQGLDVRHWNDHCLITEMYRLDVENICREQVKVEVGVEIADPDEPVNCKLPLSAYTI